MFLIRGKTGFEEAPKPYTKKESCIKKQLNKAVNNQHEAKHQQDSCQKGGTNTKNYIFFRILVASMSLSIIF